MVRNLIIISKNNLQWSRLPDFSYSPSLIIKVEKTSMEKLKLKQNFIIVSKNSLQRSRLTAFSFFPLLKIKVEKSLDKNLKSKHLAEVFGMFLFFGILKNKWLFAYERIFFWTS